MPPSVPSERSTSAEPGIAQAKEFLTYLQASLGADTPPDQRQPFEFKKFWEGSKNLQRIKVGKVPAFQIPQISSLYSQLGKDPRVWSGVLGEVLEAVKFAQDKNNPNDLAGAVRDNLGIAVALGINHPSEKEAQNPDVQEAKEVINGLIQVYGLDTETESPPPAATATVTPIPQRSFRQRLADRLLGKKPANAETAEQRIQREKGEYFALIKKYNAIIEPLKGHEEDLTYKKEERAKADKLFIQLARISDAHPDWLDGYQAWLDNHPDQDSSSQHSPATAAEQTKTNEAAEHRRQFNNLLTRWGGYRSTQLQDIDLEERRQLCEDTARFLYAQATSPEEQDKLGAAYTETEIGVALAVLRLNLDTATEEQLRNLETLENSALAEINQSKQAARLITPAVENTTPIIETEHQKQFANLRERWQKYNSTPLQNIDLEARQELLEDTARFWYDSDTSENEQFELRIPYDVRVGVSLTADRLGIHAVTKGWEERLKDLEDTYLAKVAQAKRETATPSVSVRSEDRFYFETEESIAEVFEQLAQLYKGNRGRQRVEVQERLRAERINELKYRLNDLIDLAPNESFRKADKVAATALQIRERTSLWSDAEIPRHQFDPQAAISKRVRLYHELLSHTDDPALNEAGNNLWIAYGRFRKNGFNPNDRQLVSEAGHRLESLLLAKGGFDATRAAELQQAQAETETRFVTLLLAENQNVTELTEAFTARNRASIALNEYESRAYLQTQQFLETTRYNLEAGENRRLVKGPPSAERTVEKRRPQERTVPSYNRQIEALRDAPRHPEADSWFENLAITRFEQTLADASTSKGQRDQLLASREHYIHAVSESIRDDLALAIFRARLRPDEINLPAYKETEHLRQLTDSTQVLNWHSFLDNSRKNGSFDSAALLLRQMYSSAPTNLQKSIEGLIDGKLTPTVNDLEWQAAGIDLQKWSAFQQHYQHSQEYLEGLLKDRKTPLKEVVYALIVANKSATLYSRELNKRLQTVSRYQHVLAAQNDIKITVENGKVNLERVDIEEPTEREMLQNLGNAVKEAE